MTGLTKFYTDPRGSEMKPDDVLFQLVWDDVINEIGSRAKSLTSDEMHTFRKCLENGMGCWSEVVEIAFDTAIGERKSEQEIAENLARQIRADSC